MVKKGDVLMTFDTTLSDLQLERKRLEVEKLKLDLGNCPEEAEGHSEHEAHVHRGVLTIFNYGGENGGAECRRPAGR